MDDPKKRGDAAWFSDDRAWNRHRVAWDLTHRIFIEPFDSGGLAYAAALLLTWQGSRFESHDDLVESVAVANLSKFTIATGLRNADVGDREVTESLPYVREDVAVLRPSVVLAAKPLGEPAHSVLAKSVSEVDGALVPMYQFQARAFHACQRKATPGAVDEDALMRELQAVGRLVRDRPFDSLSRGSLWWFRLLAERCGGLRAALLS